ncbi:MAG: NAD(P)H-dependent oxidoreductase subunit E, partial [Planctomycetota bacterium]|nr:NAD(P)H-dependent oxidoreductase subunit E [Planctomycetota bacterium]
ATDFAALAAKYPERRAALIPALHRLQAMRDGWLSPESIEDCAEWFELEPVEVYAVASFYPMFHLAPVGEHVVGVCRNIACHLRGAGRVLAEVENATGAKAGSTSENGRFTVETLECQGACTAAPMIVVDGEYIENIDPAGVGEILGGLE